MSRTMTAETTLARLWREFANDANGDGSGAKRETGLSQRTQGGAEESISLAKSAKWETLGVLGERRPDDFGRMTR